MTPCMVAVAYAEKFGWWLLPCHWRGDRRKQPLIKQGFYAASNDPQQVTAWWTKWPDALVGVATGASRLAVLDVDVKDPKKYGPDSLDAIAYSILHNTPIAHTPSGGWHCYFDPGDLDIPSSTHTLGPGLDVRASTGYVITPAPGSGYTWDPFYNLDTAAPLPAPAWLIPQRPDPTPIARPSPVKPVVGLSPYGDAAIAAACLNVRGAADGQQRNTLLKEAFTIGTLAGAGGIPPAFARAALIDAGCGMPSYDRTYLWTSKEIARVVDGAFDAGLCRPRHQP
jgi:putative DNA primase/helicase